MQRPRSEYGKWGYGFSSEIAPERDSGSHLEVDLKSKEFDEGLIEKLAALAEEGRISHSAEVIAAIEGSVGQ